MVKENQEYPDQKNEREIHTRQSDGELIGDNQSGINYLYTHIIEDIRKLSPTGVKSIANPLRRARKDDFITDGVVNTAIIMEVRKRLQRDGFQTVSHPDYPSYFEVKWP